MIKYGNDNKCLAFFSFVSGIGMGFGHCGYGVGNGNFIPIPLIMQ